MITINLQRYNKAIVAFFIPVVLSLLASVLGITGDMTVSQAVEALVLGVVSGAGVYQVPNKG